MEKVSESGVRGSVRREPRARFFVISGRLPRKACEGLDTQQREVRKEPEGETNRILSRGDDKTA
eukprot:2463239-Pyramimonas_sp.AAC.1